MKHLHTPYDRKPSRKKGLTINKVRGGLYKTARVLGDIQAIKKGPKAIVKRIGRRIAGRFTARLLGGLFR